LKLIECIIFSTWWSTWKLSYWNYGLLCSRSSNWGISNRTWTTKSKSKN